MAIYRFAEPSLVDKITFVPTEKGGVRGYLHASPNASDERLHLLINELRERKMDVVPFMLGDESTLEVRNFGNREKRLVHALTEAQAVNGSPQIEKTDVDKLSLWDKFRKRTLQASGVAYMVGDYGFFRYNLREADRLGVAGAFSYFLGTLALVFYGRNDQADLQVEEDARKLEGFVKKKNMKVPEDIAMHELGKDKKKSTLQKLDEFGRKYPSEVFNSVTALAGLFVATSAYKKATSKLLPGMDMHALRELHQEGWMDVGLGVTTAASGIMATLVKEKKPDPDDPPENAMDSVWQKIQAHPLAIAGVGYTVSTMFHAASTYKAWREAKRVNDEVRLKSVPGRALFVGMALLSEFLLAISSKGHGEGVASDDSVDKSLYAIAAEMIAKQPPETREHHIKQIAGYLQQPDVLADTYPVVEAELRKQVTLLDKNPWVNADDGQEKRATQHRPEAKPTALMHPAAITVPQAPVIQVPA